MIKDLLLYFALLLWFVVPSQAQPTIFAENVEAKPGDEVEVLFKVENFNDIVAWQFTFEWDSLVLEFIDFPQTNLVDLSPDNFGPAVKVNYVISTWFEDLLTPTSFPEDEVIFSMRFKVIGEADDTSKLWFSGNQLPNVVSVNGASSDLSSKDAFFTVMRTSNTVQTVPAGFDLSVSPNPFRQNTQVKFNLNNHHEDFQIVLFTLDGKKVYERQYDLSAGEHIIDIDANVLPAAGMYLMHLTSENLHTTHKLIFENY